MSRSFNIRRRDFYPLLFLLLAIVCVGMSIALWGSLSREVLLSVVGAVAALVHFMYAQHSTNTDRFVALFREFNSRFDQMNSELNGLLERDGALLLAQADKQLLYDYFNLCAEEYLYFKSGYIDGEVWAAWLRGMRSFAQHAEIRRVWETELGGGSYYGFTLALIDETP